MNFCPHTHTHTRRLCLFPRPFGMAAWLLLGLLVLCALPAAAAEEGPLEPIDTSSPRGTLTGFLEFMNKGYAKGVGSFQSYGNSSRLFMTPEEAKGVRASLQHQNSAQRTLDLSELPQDIVHETARRLAIQLKEVLDRVDLPPIESIPDADAMAKAEFKRWTVPDTEIRIQRVESGPRRGEYLFSPETMHRLPEFYEKVKEFPYKSQETMGWLDFSSYSPAGVAYTLRHFIPPRWLVDGPRYHYEVRTLILDQPLWRWVAMLFVLGLGMGFVLLCFRLSRRRASQRDSIWQWAKLLRPLSLVLVLPLLAFIFADMLRVTGTVYQVVTLSFWGLFYLALTWAVWVAGGGVAASLIASEKLLPSSIDSQLIRLVTRLLTVIAAIVILVVGANRIGLPAYSVMAGLGVGGLAVALAAQQTLANLLGSLIIMFEKPFAVGHSIRLKETEGVVENVGFRSTRIRTSYDSLVTIPSSQIVNSTIDNLELRQYRQVRTMLNLTYDTPAEKVESFADGIRQLLLDSPDTRKDKIQVYFYDFGPHSLDMLLNFFILAADRATELHKRQCILLDILRLAETMGVRYAFPTQTLHIESLPKQTPPHSEGS